MFCFISCHKVFFSSFKANYQDFPGSRVDKNLPANAKDTGSIPGPGRFHVMQSN